MDLRGLQQGNEFLDASPSTGSLGSHGSQIANRCISDNRNLSFDDYAKIVVTRMKEISF